MNDDLEEVREGAERIDTMLAQKQLSVNYDKSKYLVLGCKLKLTPTQGKWEVCSSSLSARSI